MQHLREREVSCKDQLLMLIEFQLSYMNTNHEDFIGFAKFVSKMGLQKKFTVIFVQKFSAEAKATSTVKRQRNLGNQVIRKGYLGVHTSFIGSSRDAWFVLSSDNLSWFKDDQVLLYFTPLTSFLLTPR